MVFYEETSGEMGRIQNRDFDIEAGQLGLFSTLALDHESTWPWVTSARSTQPVVL